MPIVNPYYPPIHYKERYYKDAPDFEAITAQHKYQDGGVSFNELGDDPPQTWELVYFFDRNDVTHAANLEIFDAHFKAYRYSRPFPFTEKDGNVVTNAYYKEYKPEHETYKSKLQRRRITIIYYPSAAAGGELAPSVPELYPVDILSSTGAEFSWSVAVSPVGVAGYEINVDGAVFDVGDVTVYPFGFNEANSTHSVKVRAYDNNGTRGQYSDPRVFTLSDTVGIPSVPANLQVAANSATTLTATWNASIDT